MKKTLATLSVFLLPLYLSAQQTTVSGTVKSEEGNTISGVTIRDRNTGTSVTSDENGHFTISANPKDVLEFYVTDYSLYTG